MISKSFFGEHDDGFFRGVGSGGIGVEVDDNFGGEALEEVDLVLGEGSAAGGEHVLNSGEVDGDAVHLAFDEDDEVELPDGLLCLVEIEEDLALGIEGRLRRVHVLGAGLVAGIECAGGEGDNAARLIGDGEGDALAETRVERAGRAVLLLFEREEAGEREGFQRRPHLAGARGAR